MSLLSACATKAPDNTFAVAAGEYDAAFDAAREVLRDYRFPIDRVDARRGVISTAGAHSAGLAAPWDRYQSTIVQELEDLANRQERIVRITFEADEPAGDDPEALDLAGVDEPLTGRVQVVIYRFHRAGWRLESEWIALSRYAHDPLMARRHGTSYTVPIARDPPLERALAGKIAARLRQDRPSPRRPIRR